MKKLKINLDILILRQEIKMVYPKFPRKSEAVASTFNAL